MSTYSIEWRRRKRSTGVLLPLQNNELPGAEYQYKEDGVWEERKPYKTLQTQPPDKSKNKKKQRKGPQQKSQTLQFDEQTLKKARRKQRIEPRNCARRYLKVDFADIGWSEWIISPKSFDAYYCSGACQFIRQQIWKTQKLPQEEKISFHSNTKRAMPKNVQSTIKLHSFQMLAR